jgi:hypothetical protein
MLAADRRDRATRLGDVILHRGEETIGALRLFVDAASNDADLRPRSGVLDGDPNLFGKLSVNGRAALARPGALVREAPSES